MISTEIMNPIIGINTIILAEITPSITSITPKTIT